MYNIIIYGDVGKYPWVDLEVLGVYTPVWTHLGPLQGPHIWAIWDPLRDPLFPSDRRSRGTPHLDPFGTPRGTPQMTRFQTPRGSKSGPKQVQNRPNQLIFRWFLGYFGISLDRIC